jgi:hypothetical protein
MAPLGPAIGTGRHAQTLEAAGAVQHLSVNATLLGAWDSGLLVGENHSH